jgi:hypothetical protein
MLNKIKAVVTATYNLAWKVADDWWQLAICWSAFGAIAVNCVVLPIIKGTPASPGELAATIASATGLVAVHAWKTVNSNAA